MRRGTPIESRSRNSGGAGGERGDGPVLEKGLFALVSLGRLNYVRSSIKFMQCWLALL